jgi:hypothetical protein
MGDRGQVRFIYSDYNGPAQRLDGNGGEVWFYTHWGAGALWECVASALRRGKGRWDDDEYLARIIFCEMVGNDVDGTTGFGIGMSRHGDVWQVITVDAGNQTVTVEEPRFGPVSFEAFASGDIRLLAEVSHG